MFFRKILPFIAVALAVATLAACKATKQTTDKTQANAKPSANPKDDEPLPKTEPQPTAKKEEPKVVVVVPPPAPKQDEALLNALQMVEKVRLSPNWLVAKADIGYEDDRMSQSATAHLRMKKDEAIWISVRKLGIEGARILITRDSFQMLNRLQRNYTTGKLSTLMAQYQLPLDFNGLQNLFWGNAIFMGKQQPTAMNVENGNYVLTSLEGGMKAQYVLDMTNFLVKNMVFNDAAKGRNVGLLLSKHQKIATNDKQPFSFMRLIKLNSRQTGNVSIDIEFKEVTLNQPKEIEFEVPSSYKKTN